MSKVVRSAIRDTETFTGFKLSQNNAIDFEELNRCFAPFNAARMEGALPSLLCDKLSVVRQLKEAIVSGSVVSLLWLTSNDRQPIQQLMLSGKAVMLL